MNDQDLELTPAEQALAEQLNAARPAPAPTFRGTLSRRLAALDRGFHHRPARLWAWAGGLTGSGVVLLVVGLLVAKG